MPRTGHRPPPRITPAAAPAAASPLPRLAWLLLPLYTLSGGCALALETIWIRALGLYIGNTIVSATLVIAVFFFSAALGNLWGGGVVRRSARPARLYGLFEALAGLSALGLYPLRGLLYSLLHGAVPADGGALTLLLHVVYTLLLVGLPSFFAGCAFPALTAAFIAHVERRTARGGGFYAGNLLGAATGVLAGGVWLPLAWGYAAAVGFIATLQIGIGLLAWWLARHGRPLPTEPASPAQTPTPLLPPALGYAILIGSGLLSIMLEMLVLSYFQQLLVGSIYATSAVLFAFIINLGLGSLLATWLRARGMRTAMLLGGMLAVGGGLLLGYPAVFHQYVQTGFAWAAAGPAALISHAIFTATLLLAPALLCLGTVFPLSWEIIERANPHHGQALGRAVAVNKLGAAAGAGLASFLLVPWLGLPGAVLVTGGLYLLLALAVGLAIVPRGAGRLVVGIAGALLAVLAGALFLTRRPPVLVKPGERLLATYQGAEGVVAVLEDARASRHIVLNQSYTLNGTGHALQWQRHESWIPLLLCAQPRRVAFIGMASGISAAAALETPVEELQAIELEPQVVRAARAQFRPWNGRLFTDPRARVLVADGRYVIQSARSRYDVIICDLFHPALAGAGDLYAREFFATMRGRLAPGGRCCVWLPVYQLDEELAGMVIRTFLDVFPHAIAVRGNLDPLQPIVGLVGANEPIDLSTAFLTRQLQSETGRRLAAHSPFFRSVANTRLLLLGDLGAVRGEFARYPVTTDNHPLFTFRGPKQIPAGKHLRGYPFLNWFGTRFLRPAYPSCILGDTPPEELLQGIRAGNYYFAAGIAWTEIPADAYQRFARLQQAAGYLARARVLSPRSDLTPEELGR